MVGIRALVIASMVVASPAVAETLTMKQFDSTNLHMADNRGAMHWSADITITMTLGTNKRVTVLSKGTRGDHQMDVINNASYNTDTKTEWTTGWKGVWKIEKGVLVLQLGVLKNDCSKVKDDRGTKTNETCSVARESAVMRCSTETVELGDGKKKTKVAAWRCAPDDPRDLGESPTSWLFGKKRCIQVSGGRKMPMSYSPCP